LARSPVVFPFFFGDLVHAQHDVAALHGFQVHVVKWFPITGEVALQLDIVASADFGAVEKCYVEANPVNGVKRRATNGARSRVLAEAELVEVWRACGEDDYGRIVRLLILDLARQSWPSISASPPHGRMPAKNRWRHGSFMTSVNDRPRLAGKSKYTNLSRFFLGIYDLIGIVWLRRRTRLPAISEDTLSIIRLREGGLRRVMRVASHQFAELGQ
jgi:hypothetical protein